MEVVSSVWSKPVRHSNAATTLCRKLKALRYELKHWSKGISKLTVAIANSNKTLAEIDELENKRTLTLPETNFRKILKKHLLRLLSYQREYWRKRCTVRWVKFDDERPSFFQAMASKRYHKNNIPTLLMADGTEVEDHAGKEAIIYQSFKERLGTSGNF